MVKFNHDAEKIEEAIGLKSESTIIETVVDFAYKNVADKIINKHKKSEVIEGLFNKSKEDEDTLLLLCASYVIETESKLTNLMRRAMGCSQLKSIIEDLKVDKD